MVFDVTRLESLKSLESWLAVAIERSWISSGTKIILIANKIDLVKPNLQFIEQVENGIFQMLKNSNIDVSRSQICSKKVSAINLDGMPELRNEIFEWVAHHGKQKEVDEPLNKED